MMLAFFEAKAERKIDGVDIEPASVGTYGYSGIHSHFEIDQVFGDLWPCTFTDIGNVEERISIFGGNKAGDERCLAFVVVANVFQPA